MIFTSKPITILFQILSLLLLISPSSPRGEKDDGIIITQQDYNGLQAFKHSISDPRGFLRSWNGTGIGACSGSWVGIKCVRGKVIAITLPWRGLSGHITEKIGQLTALRKLSLHDNSIGGQIPMAIRFLHDLRGVYLFNNEFSGSIPPSIGNCNLLQALDLSNNLLTGSIPSEISNSTRLYRLNLSYNNLSGSVPDNWRGGRGTRLQILNLGHNFISGRIPISLSRLKMLAELVLSHNLLNGSIPREIGNLSMLRIMDFSNNSLSGEIPSTLSRLANLTSLNVSYNKLSGSVPILLSKKFNSSSFKGNIHLCGYSVLAPCLSPNLPSQSTPSEYKHRKLSTKIIIIIAAGIAIVLLVILCCLLLYCLLTKKNSLSGKSTEEKQVPGEKAEAKETKDGGGKLVHFDGPTKFSADDLLCATAEILGKSTYGTVYKATLEDGSQVAVKRLREKYAKSAKEFEVEVNILGKVRHANVLELRAYYLGPKGEKLLVFDYMPKGSLAAFLHARGPDTSVDWRTRLSIAIGTTRALNHLHNAASIIHGNLTSNNILLDENASPKIADIALFRLMTPAANSNAIAAAAALGYRAPELHNIKKANAKTDVYSLGVVMLELLTGKSPSGVVNNGVELTQWVASAVKEEWSNEVFDVELLRNVEEDGDELVEVLKLSLQCVDQSPVARPEVEQVLRRLEELAGIDVAETSTSAAGG